MKGDNFSFELEGTKYYYEVRQKMAISGMAGRVSHQGPILAGAAAIAYKAGLKLSALQLAVDLLEKEQESISAQLNIDLAAIRAGS